MYFRDAVALPEQLKTKSIRGYMAVGRVWEVRLRDGHRVLAHYPCAAEFSREWAAWGRAPGGKWRRV